MKKLKTCPLHNLDYYAADCPYCRREEKWNSRIYHKVVRQRFSPRIQSDLREFGITNEIMQDSCFLHGLAKTGKTLTAAGMLINRIKYDYVQNLRGQRYCFVSFPDLIMKVNSAMDSDDSVYDIVNQYKDFDYLVIDDFPTMKVSDWVYQISYMIINYRYEQLLPTIFTSNYSLDNIAEMFNDERLARRIFDMCTEIKEF